MSSFSLYLQTKFLIETARLACHFQFRYSSILQTFLNILIINYKMYNSEENQDDDDNRNLQSQAASFNEQKNGRLNNSRPKNLLQKNNGIFGTYARIVPKKPLHDLQRLYAQNIQLRERIRFLQQDNTKTKTRVSMAQKQKQQLINQLANYDFNNGMLKDRRPSIKGLTKNSQKPNKIALDENRRILHGYKDQISKLKLQNGRLKKTVKYTQIQQLETQNQLLHQEMARMKKYVHDVLDSLEYDQYQKQIDNLNKQLQGEKDAIKSMHVQMRKKDQEIEEVRNKMKIIATRKSQLEKKYNRDLNSIKGQLHRKQKEFYLNNNQQDRESTSKQKKTSQAFSCKKCPESKLALQKLKNKNQQLEQILNNKNKQIAEIKIKLRQLQKKQGSGHEKQSGKNKQQKAQKTSPTKQQKIQVQGSSSNTNKQKQKQKQLGDGIQSNHAKNGKQENKSSLHQPNQEKQKQKQKQKQKYKQKKVGDKQSQPDYQDDQEQLYNEKESNPEQSEDKVDVFHVNMNHQKNGPPAETKHKADTQKEEEQKYEDEFNQLEEHKKQFNDQQSQQEVLFQKQQKPNTKNTRKKSQQKQESKGHKQKGKHRQSQRQQSKHKQQQKAKGKEKGKQKTKQKQKQKQSKAEKILKQTIKYRLIAQRYTYADFERDIKDSQAQQFNVEQLIQMLTHQPFFLSQQHLQMVAFGIFKKEQIDDTDSVSASSFLKTMKVFIGQFDLNSEQEQQKIFKSIQNKIRNDKLLNKMEEQSIDGRFISKKGFVKVLKQTGGLTDAEIEQSLAEASVLSVDIAHIAYEQFIQKIATNNQR